MPVTEVRPGRLYSFSETFTGVGVYSVGEAVAGVRPISANGYLSYNWSAALRLLTVPDWAHGYDSERHSAFPYAGRIEVGFRAGHRLTEYLLQRYLVATHKHTAVFVGASLTAPGTVYSRGSGGNSVVVDVGSDRAWRGDTIFYEVIPGVDLLVTGTVTTFFADNSFNNDTYSIVV